MQLNLKQVELPISSYSFEPHEVFPSGLDTGFVSTRKATFDTLGEGNPDDFSFSYILYPYKRDPQTGVVNIGSNKIPICSYQGKKFLSRTPIDYRGDSLLFSEVTIDTLGRTPHTQRFGVMRLTESGAELTDISYLQEGRIPFQMITRDSVFTVAQSFASGLPETHPDPQILVLGDNEDRLSLKEKFAGLLGSLASLPLAFSPGPISEYGLFLGIDPENSDQLGYFIQDRKSERFFLHGYIPPFDEETMPNKHCINEDGIVVGLYLDSDDSSFHPMTWNRYGYTQALRIPENHKGSEIYITGITSIFIAGEKYSFVSAEFVDHTSRSSPYGWIIDDNFFGEGFAATPFPLDFQDAIPSQLKSVHQGGITLLQYENFPGKVSTGIFSPTMVSL
jgi:hypothetical protein